MHIDIEQSTGDRRIRTMSVERAIRERERMGRERDEGRG